MILHLIKPRLISFIAIIFTIEILNLLHILNESEESSAVSTFNPSFRKILSVVDTEVNCGVKQTCPPNSFSLFLSTGASPDILPRLCVSGKDVIRPRVKEESRGLNGAIIEPNYFEAISVQHFDTYGFNKSTEIIKWVTEAYNNSIIVLFTFDEASLNLDDLTKAVLISLGSGKIQNLFFRSQWFMITQKGRPGFTVYEKLSHAKKKRWGDKIEFQGCIPKIIPKRNIIVDEPLRENRQKVQFCKGKKDDKYKGFCSEPRFEIIMPALLTNKSLVGNSVYFMPIFLFASSNLEIFIASIESLIHQPGITLTLVTVLYEVNATLNSHKDDITSLCKIYGINSSSIRFMASFEQKIEQIRRILSKVAPHKQYALVIDSEVILSPDFLFFMAQTLPIMQKDKEISVISAWSSNCYAHEGNVHEVYRIRGALKYAALISIAKKVDNFMNMFAPDVARLQGPEACHIPSLEPNNWIERPQDLLKYRYFHKMVMLQQLSQIIEVDEILNSCSSSVIKNEANVVYIEKGQLGKILHCLGVIKNQYGIYEGIVRLFVNGKNVLVITNESSFYKSRPVASIPNPTKFKMANNDLSYNCRLKLQQRDDRTSTQIGLQYNPEKVIMFEKAPLPEVPKMRFGQQFTSGKIYTPKDYYVTTYNEKFKPILENPNVQPSKLLGQEREYIQMNKSVRPMRIYETEYKEEYPEKFLPANVEGFNIEKFTSCPMIVTGRDEREALPLTENYFKYLDIYLSTTRMDHRPFTLHEQKTIAMKDIVTSQETMDIPKGRAFGRKFPVYLDKDLEKRDKNMNDSVLFPTEAKLRFLPNRMPKVPFSGSESETQAAYKKPEGCTIPFLHARFAEFPTTIHSSSAKQSLCAPGMYTTESQAINKHTSPQVIV